MRGLARTLIVLTLSLGCSTALAACLDEAADFAGRICGEVSNRGASRIITTSGELTAEAKGLIRQILGTAGGTVKADAEIITYENVVREQLGPELINVRDCKTRMAEAAIKAACTKPSTYRTCRHRDFGQTGWAREEVLQGTSGWRGGGYNQNAWCDDLIRSSISARQLGGTSYLIEKVSSSEEGRWTGTFNRDRQYNYHCKVKLLWEPIYNERTDPRCGILN